MKTNQRRGLLCFAATALLGIAIGSASAAEPKPEDIVRTLDERARSELGVGIVALGLLVEAGPRDVFLADGLRNDGRMPAVDELEKAGYVVVNRFPSPDGELLTLIPTAKAAPVIGVLKAE